MSKPRRQANRTNKERRRRKNRQPRFESLECRNLLAADFTLQLLHASDLEGGVNAIGAAPNFGAIVEGLENDAADAGTPSILLSAGDNYIPGPFFNAAGDRGAFRDSGLFNDIYNELFGVSDYNGLREGNGRVDISIMNVLGFDASAVGNHEFDAGSDAFESIIEEDFRDPAGPPSDRWVGAQFPYLSANLDFSGDADLGNLYTSDILPSTDFITGPDQSIAGNTSVPKLAPATVIERDGQFIGVVGATTQLIDTISSPAGTVDVTGGVVDMDALAGVIQPVVNELTGAMGVNKVILVSHLQQISLEQSLATKLTGVDIIVAGGSDTILANPDDTLQAGDVAGGSYPLITSDLGGDPTVIVSTAGEYSYVGQLTVVFDDTGVLVDGDNNPIDSMDDLDLTKNGPIATTDASVDAIWGVDDPFAVGTKGEQVQRLVDAVTDVVNTTDGNIFGATEVFIDGLRENVRTQETNMGNLTADANLSFARDFDGDVVLSLKNGGGIRAPIGEIDGFSGELLPPQGNPGAGKEVGEISQLDIENSLRFNNGLTVLTVSADSLKILLEHAVAGTSPGATPGQFPQVGGVSFSFDPTGAPIAFNSDTDIADGSPLVQSPGTRIQNVALIDEDGKVTDILVKDGVVLQPNRDIRLVTLDFLFGVFSSSPNFGGDGYPYPALATDVVQLRDQGLADGEATFTTAGTEQDALAEYLSANFPNDDRDPTDAKPSFTSEEVGPELDRRIQNLAFRADTVIPVAGAARVTNELDFGEGSFRNAVQIANDNPRVRRILFDKNVDLVEVGSPVEYTGSQRLEIKGEGVTILAGDELEGAGVFISSNAADLVFSKLTIDGDYDTGEFAANGIFVPVPEDATGTLSVQLKDVTLQNAGLFGLHIADQINDSDASISLVIKKSTVENNGIGALDFDGVRVDEGGEGNIFARIDDTHIDGNGGDGLELDERGNGSVRMTVEDSTFNENGFFNEEDLDDGLDIDEAGSGSVIVTMEDVDLIDNKDEGLDLDEEDEGGIYMRLEDIKVEGNFDEGVKASEEDEGNVTARFEDVKSNGNGDDGIELEEEDEGRINVRFEDVETEDNGDAGIQISESGDGSLIVRFEDVVSKDNSASGAEFEENGDGNLRVKIEDSDFDDNGEFGVIAVQEDEGSGRLEIEDVSLEDNDLGPLDLDGVILVEDD